MRIIAIVLAAVGCSKPWNIVSQNYGIVGQGCHGVQLNVPNTMVTCHDGITEVSAISKEDYYRITGENP